MSKIRKTVSESEAMIEQVERRIAQTDELLAEHGISREQLLQIKPTPEQMEAVNDELRRRGLEPIEELDLPAVDAYPELGRAAEPNFESPEFISGDDELENRKRTFNTMMHNWRL